MGVVPKSSTSLASSKLLASALHYLIVQHKPNLTDVFSMHNDELSCTEVLADGKIHRRENRAKDYPHSKAKALNECRRESLPNSDVQFQ